MNNNTSCQITLDQCLMDVIGFYCLFFGSMYLSNLPWDLPWTDLYEKVLSEDVLIIGKLNGGF